MMDATLDEQLGLRPGDLLAERYCVGHVIARGGMGYVIAATHRELGTPFAVKILKVKFARDETYLARFRREAYAAARLKSEHIVRVVDFGRAPSSGAPFLVMEYLEGHDLASALEAAKARGTALSLRDTCDYIIQACNGLAVAHAAGIVHRDLKPANLFLTQQADGSPCVKVLDFGISKHGSEDDMALTAPREVLGSPIYMSPEQLKSPRTVDARSDLWSLGVILFELLAGRVPFDDKEFGELFMRIQTGTAPSLLKLRPDLPPELGALIARCLEKDPAARFPDVAALANELAAFASPGAQHYVNSTSRVNGRPPTTKITTDVLSNSQAAAVLPADEDSAPAWRGGRRPRRVVFFSALAGIALGYGTWTLVRHHGPAQAMSRSLAGLLAPKQPIGPDVKAPAVPPLPAVEPRPISAVPAPEASAETAATPPGATTSGASATATPPKAPTTAPPGRRAVAKPKPPSIY